jgi:spermidine synthase
VIPSRVIERVETRGGEMVLVQRGGEFTIRIGGLELMGSRNHTSEDALGEWTCQRITGVDKPRVMIGGLGLGFTLRAALDKLPPGAHAEVIELVPEVVKWNRTVLGQLAGHPLDDPRTECIQADVGEVIARSKDRYDAIMLDVDNGPDEIFERNNQLYRRTGLQATHAALRSRGLFSVWSTHDSPTFTKWLRDTGFEVELEKIRTQRGGPRHYIWFARKL